MTNLKQMLDHPEWDELLKTGTPSKRALAFAWMVLFELLADQSDKKTGSGAVRDIRDTCFLRHEKRKSAKVVVDGYAYNTVTSSVVFTHQDSTFNAELYQTVRGRFFCVYRSVSDFSSGDFLKLLGDSVTMYSDDVDLTKLGRISIIVPFSKEQAIKWCRILGDDRISQLYSAIKVAEGDRLSAVSLRIPRLLTGAIDEAAKKSNMSRNEWIMRRLESGVSEDSQETHRWSGQVTH